VEDDDIERSALVRSETILQQLQKLKERNKLFPTMTVEHNQLLLQLGEIKTHPSIAQTTKLVGCL
jgi:hypothetical protein